MTSDSMTGDRWYITVWQLTNDLWQYDRWQVIYYSMTGDNWPLTVWQVTGYRLQYDSWKMTSDSLTGDRWRLTVWQLTNDLWQSDRWQLRANSMTANKWPLTVWQVTVYSWQYDSWQMTSDSLTLFRKAPPTTLHLRAASVQVPLQTPPSSYLLIGVFIVQAKRLGSCLMSCSDLLNVSSAASTAGVKCSWLAKLFALFIFFFLMLKVQ